MRRNENRERVGEFSASPKRSMGLKLLLFGPLYVSGAITSRVDKLGQPPTWAEEWDNNTMVREPEEEKPFAFQPRPMLDFSRLGELLG